MMTRVHERVAVVPADFGATQEGLDLILRLHDTKEDIPNNVEVIDVTQAVDRVVEKYQNACEIKTLKDLLRLLDGMGST